MYIYIYTTYTYICIYIYTTYTYIGVNYRLLTGAAEAFEYKWGLDVERKVCC